MLALKEFVEAEHDILVAKQSFDMFDYKWSTIHSYYAMFHSSKAISFALGYSENKHIAIIAVLNYLSKQGILEDRFVGYFISAMQARENADYHYVYSKEVAEFELEKAVSFVSELKGLFDNLYK